MTSSDLIDSHQASEGMSAQAGASEAESAESALGGHDHGENVHGENVTEKRIALPKPDTNNITVLTENLPNDPILPWHHFDSPWLEKDEPAAEETPEEEILSTDDDDHEQLSLALDEVADTETEPKPETSTGDSAQVNSID